MATLNENYFNQMKLACCAADLRFARCSISENDGWFSAGVSLSAFEGFNLFRYGVDMHGYE